MSKETSNFAPLLTHLLVGAVGSLAAVQLPSISPWFVYITSAFAIFTLSFLFCSYLRARMRHGLAIIENAVVTGEKPPGTSEFHQAASNIVTHVSRLATVAAKGREQSREVEAVLTALDRRNRDNGKSNPSRQLTLMLKSLGTSAQQKITALDDMGSALGDVGAELEKTVAQQNELVREAADEIELLAESAKSVNAEIKDAKSNDSATTEVTESVSNQLVELQEQLEQLRDQIVECEKKSQLLRDHTVEISSLMQTIHEHSSKTDTMALNASIESVRAGEHGRGFAAAADEIRKLTGIITDSTRNVLDRLQLVETSVDETASICSQGHTTIDGQVGTARDLTQSMSEIRLSTNQSREHLDQVLQTADSQLASVASIAQTLEGIFLAAERASLHVKDQTEKRNELTESLEELSGLLSPLTGKPRDASPTPAQQGAPVAAPEEFTPAAEPAAL